MALTICSVCRREAPCSGRSDTIVYWPDPTGAVHVEMLSGVADPLPPPDPPPLPPLELLPQAAANASVARTAAARMARLPTVLIRLLPSMVIPCWLTLTLRDVQVPPSRQWYLPFRHSRSKSLDEQSDGRVGIRAALLALAVALTLAGCTSGNSSRPSEAPACPHA